MSSGGQRHSGYCVHDNIKRRCELCAKDAEIAALREQLAGVERERDEEREHRNRLAKRNVAVALERDAEVWANNAATKKLLATRQQLAEARKALEKANALARVVHILWCGASKIYNAASEHSGYHAVESKLIDRLREAANEFDAFLATAPSEAAPGSEAVERVWMCVTCGTVSDSHILTDDTTCKCNDIYEQAWCNVPCTAKERGNCKHEQYGCKWLDAVKEQGSEQAALDALRQPEPERETNQKGENHDQR